MRDKIFYLRSRCAKYYNRIYNLHLNLMDDPSENYDNEPIEEAFDPLPSNEAPDMVEDSDSDDNLPEFANEENKKLK